MQKIKVTISYNKFNLLTNDAEEFGITINKLCNYIFEKLKYNKKIETEKLLEIQGKPIKKYICFDLNISNKKDYYEILKKNEVEVEAEYFRKLFNIYVSKSKYQRELFIFESNVRIILEAIKQRKKIEIKYLRKLLKIAPYFIHAEDRGEENFLFCYDEIEKEYKNLKLKEVEIISIIDETFIIKDEKYVKILKKNFSPFLEKEYIIKVKFTEKGKSLLKSLTNYRPKFLKKEDEIYLFKASKENTKLYFRQFAKEVEILEPIELRQEIKNEILEILSLYKDK